jgi:hypothetical protein
MDSDEGTDRLARSPHPVPPRHAWDTRCDPWSSPHLSLVHASLLCRTLRALLCHRDDLVDGCLHRVFPSHVGGQLLGGVPE